MKVFEELRDAFRLAVENFKRELNRDEVTGSVDELLSEMRDELVDARAYVHRLERDFRRAVKQVEAEREQASICRRREEMARKIDDEETARIAADFAERHESRKKVLERKAAALQEEMDLRKKEVEEMTDRLKEARSRREDLAATAGRSRARETLGSDDLFVELDRMEENIDGEARTAESAREVGEMFSDDLDEEPAAETRSVEERLAELKRRMESEEERGG